MELNSSKLQGCLDTEIIGSNLCLVLIFGHVKGDVSKHSGEGRSWLEWAVRGCHPGADSVGNGFKTYFWPQVKVPVYVEDAEDAPKAYCQLQSYFSFPQSSLKTPFLQEEYTLC